MGRVFWGRVIIGVGCVALVAGCSGGVDRTGSTPAPATAEPTLAATPSAPVYEGPDEFNVREDYLPLLQTQQAVAQDALGEVSWLEEPTFAYRQAMTGVVSASLFVSGTTKAGPDRAQGWLAASNEVLAAHGFEQAAELTTDAGGGLLIISPKQAAGACYWARWGQGSVNLTVDVGAVDSPCTGEPTIS